MKKLILFLIFCIVVLLTMSCTGENSKDNTETTSKESYGKFIDENGDVTMPFSYEMELKHIEKSKPILGDPNNFKNTTETEVNTQKKAMELAKNELIWQYNPNQITVGYDKSFSMWSVTFIFNYLNSQRVFIDSKGITKLITRGFQSLDDSVVLHSFDSEIEELELLGGIRMDSNKFKNITETEVKTKEDAIELARNELIEEKEYDRIFVSYDDLQSMWGVIFWVDEVDDKLSGGQYIFIDSKGITQVILTAPYLSNSYTEYSEFLEKRGGIRIEPSEFRNTTETEIDLSNIREETIKLAKNELTGGYDYNEIAVYWDTSEFVYIASFWADNAFTKGEHIFIDIYGITKLIIHTD